MHILCLFLALLLKSSTIGKIFMINCEMFMEFFIYTMYLKIQLLCFCEIYCDSFSSYKFKKLMNFITFFSVICKICQKNVFL